MRNAGSLMILVAALGACVEQPAARRTPQGVSAQEVEAVRRRVASNTAPTPQHPLDIKFGDKVTLIGYDLAPAAEQIRPGSNITVTWYWKVDGTVGDGWKLYTHLDDANGPKQNHDGEGDVRRAYQPERWRRGEFVTDRQTFEIPAEWDSNVVKVHIGLWRGDERMRVVRGETDSSGRALAFSIPIRVAVAPQQPVSQLEVPKVTTAPTVDGQLNEPAWASAAMTGALVNPNSGAAAGAGDARGSVKVLWDDQNLYLGWEVSDDHLIETGAERDAHQWENDAIEVLIDPDGDGRNYYELQVSPGGHTFDSQQPQPPTGGSFGNTGWNPNIRVAVVRNGTLGNPADTDTGYTVEVAIPWSDVNQGAAHTPPQVGDSWRVNFFLMDKPKDGPQRFGAWSAPRSGSFHNAARFGRLNFRGPVNAAPTGAAAPAAPAARTTGTAAAPAVRPAVRTPAPTPAPAPAR